MLFSLVVLLAQEPQKVGDGGVPPWANFVPIFLMLIALYFLVLLPQQRKDRRQREMLFNTLKKNDEVVTAGGIIGIVQMIKDGDEVVLKIDDNTKMRILKSSIVRIVPKETPTTTPTT
jgi:preprotein translocase subunit YajC